MSSVIAMLVIVALVAYIAMLRGRQMLALVLIILAGAMLAQMPGWPGQWAGRGAHFTTQIPAKIARVVS